MSKRAEERALEAYPQNEIIVYGPLPGANEPNRIDDNLKYRIGYIEGYEQAEKDLGWISVKDRLPEEPGYYITCCEDNGVAQAIGLTFYNSDIQSWLDYDDIKCIVYVDYWMEVPKLKK